jgi:hypothetical protein
MMDKTEPKRACNNCSLSPEALVDYGKLNDGRVQLWPQACVPFQELPVSATLVPAVVGQWKGKLPGFLQAPAPRGALRCPGTGFRHRRVGLFGAAFQVLPDGLGGDPVQEADVGCRRVRAVDGLVLRPRVLRY